MGLQPAGADERQAAAERVLREHVRLPGRLVWSRRFGVVPWLTRLTRPRCRCGSEWPCPIASMAEQQASTFRLAMGAIIAGEFDR